MRNECTITEAKQALKTAIRGYLLKDEKGNYLMREVSRLPLYLEGAPGLGKTEIAKQTAEELNMGFVSFSLTHHTRNSLLGLPVICDMKEGESAEGKYTSYTMSEVLAKVYEAKKDGHDEGILLLDEFPCMSPTIMPAMLAFLQTKNIGTHVLPEGWVIILCGNPPEFNDHSVRFDAAITDRIRTIPIRWDEQAFLNYAKEQKFHESIIEYLELNPRNIYRVNDKELVTCRGWENFSHTLKANEMLMEEVDYYLIRQFIKSDAIAENFQNFYRKSMGIKKEDILQIIRGENLAELAEKYSQKDGNIRLHILSLVEEYLRRAAEPLEKKETERKWFQELFKKAKAVAKDRKELPFTVLKKCIFHSEIAAELYPSLTEYVQVEDPKKFADITDQITELFSKKEAIHGRTKAEKEELFAIQTKRIEQFLRAQKAENDRSWKGFSENMSHVFQFLGSMENGAVYQERFFYFVNQNRAFLNCVANIKCKEYMQFCNKIYGM